MKQIKLTFLFTILMSMVGTRAFAHDIEVANADGVTIYYTWINNNTELAVSYKGTTYDYFSNEYQGSVTIPESVTYDGKTYSVTSIGGSAFRGCSGLTSIDIPNSVTSIGYYAFYGSKSLTSVTIPNSVTSIGGWAFYGCTGLTKVIVNDIVAWCNISFADQYSNPLYYAKHFYCDENTEITNLVIPNGVTKIKLYAFYNCSGLTSVTIPNSVTSIGYAAFYDCSRLTSVTIPNSVTSIGSDAFRGCSGLTSIDIPNSVTSIGSDAFRGCSGLTSVTIPNSVTSIGDYAFYGCSRLTKVIVNDIAAWCNILFTNAISNPLYYAKHLYCDENAEITNLVIPNEVTNIKQYAFYNCSGLTSVTIPNSVTSIGSDAFSSCSGLTEINVHEGNTVYSSIDGVLFNKSKTELIRYPEGKQGAYTISNSVTSIGDSAFYNCSGMTSIDIPNSVTSIGSSAFYYCSGLSSVIINSNAILSKTYSSESSLKNIFGKQVKEYQIGNGVKKIGNYAFYGCSGLTSVTIPNSVTSIGESAFWDCGLKKVIWLPTTPPDGYGQVGGIKNYVPNDSYTVLNNKIIYPYLSSMFEVDGIKYVPVSPSEKTCDAIDCVYDSSAEIIRIDNTVTYRGITMTIKNLNSYLFYQNKFIKSVEVKYDGIIGSYAFYDCTGLTSIDISNSVTSIGSYAFYGCTGLTSIDIPNSVTSIGNYAFYGCTGLTSIDIPNSMTSIGNSAFHYCSGLTSVTIPNSVKSIGESAFSQCYQLTSVTIPNSVKSIGSSVFYYCSRLTSVTIPNSVTSIGSSAFYYCSGLTSVTIPNSVTSIGESAFYKCSRLTSVTIPNSVKSIGKSAFSDCSGLTSVTIGNSVTSIGSNAFQNCSSLTSITINSNTIMSKNYTSSSSLKSIFGNQVKQYILGDNVKSIGDYAFNGCSILNDMTISKSVTSIGKEAFNGCSITKLTSCAVTPPLCSSQALADIDKWNCTLIIPTGSLSAYQAADQWKDFFFIEESDVTAIRNVNDEIKNGEIIDIYDLKGRKIESLQRGINIVRMSNGTTKKIIVK